jgi:Flp pilus assembly protein TadG
MTVRLDGERGSAATKLVLIAPILVALLLFVAVCGRLVMARGDVEAAARDAARAASTARDPATADASAQAAAAAAVGSGNASCERLAVDVDAGDWRPGGTVAVSVTCPLRLGDLALIHVPGVREVTGRATAPVDLYRGLR